MKQAIRIGTLWRYIRGCTARMLASGGGDHHRGPNSIETMLDPDNLCRIWSREEELEALSHTEIERDETIKQLDEFGSKEVTFY